jgi:hypothetical protein
LAVTRSFYKALQERFSVLTYALVFKSTHKVSRKLLKYTTPAYYLMTGELIIFRKFNNSFLIKRKVYSLQ